MELQIKDIITIHLARNWSSHTDLFTSYFAVLPAAIKYPLYKSLANDKFIQNFPFRTLNMVITLLCIVIGSFIARAAFKYCLPKRLDVFEEFQDDIPDIQWTKIIEFDGMYENMF